MDAELLLIVVFAAALIALMASLSSCCHAWICA